MVITQCLKQGLVSAAVSVLLALSSTALAMPSLNPHPHILVGWHDADKPNTPDHNHHHVPPLSIFPLYPGNGVARDETANSPLDSVGDADVNVAFDAYSAWDQNGNQALYRNGDAVQDFGHGFIRQSVPYLFEPDSRLGANDGVPAAARTDIAAAWTTWGTQTAATFNSLGLPALGLVLGMDFKPGAAEDTSFDRLLQPAEDLNGNGAMDGFTVTWEENGIAGVLARWLPGSQQLQINGTINWFFGGAGNIPAGQTDFETIMLHEEGHILGLNHINTGTADDIMRADIVNQAQAAGTVGVRTPDIGSLFGAVTLYTQPTPEPGTVLMFATGLLGLLGYGWRRKKPAA
jgi:hypothetical protein